jgi:hypothetical protein
MCRRPDERPDKHGGFPRDLRHQMIGTSRQRRQTACRSPGASSGTTGTCALPATGGTAKRVETTEPIWRLTQPDGCQAMTAKSNETGQCRRIPACSQYAVEPLPRSEPEAWRRDSSRAVGALRFSAAASSLIFRRRESIEYGDHNPIPRNKMIDCCIERSCVGTKFVTVTSTRRTERAAYRGQAAEGAPLVINPESARRLW